MESNEKITVDSIVNAPIEKVWEMYNNPEHVKKWNSASEDWHTPYASNNLTVGGSFNYRMESKDGKEGFDFEGIYTEVEENAFFAYEMSDGRKVDVKFESVDENSTKVTVTFDPENKNPADFQREGWQSILDNFKKYVEKA